MATNRRRRKLKRLSGIQVDEVSLVDKPANLIPFLFSKNLSADDLEAMEKQFKGVKIELDIGTTQDETTIKLNGKVLKNLESISLWYSPTGGNDVSVAVEYTQSNKGDTVDGFASSRSYRLSKGIQDAVEAAEEKRDAADKSDNEDRKADVADIAAVRAVSPEIGDEIDGPLAKALAEPAAIVARYAADLPPELRGAIENIVLAAAETEPVLSTPETPVKKNDDDDDANKDDDTNTDGDGTPAVTPTPVPGVAMSVDNLVDLMAPKMAAKLGPELAASVAAALKLKEDADAGGSADDGDGKDGDGAADDSGSADGDDEEEVTPEEFGQDLATAMKEALTE